MHLPGVDVHEVELAVKESENLRRIGAVGAVYAVYAVYHYGPDDGR
jgi:hypothetical protein